MRSYRRSYNLLITASIFAICSSANASFDVDQSMLDDLGAGQPPATDFAAADRLLAATSNMFQMPLRQRMRAEVGQRMLEEDTTQVAQPRSDILRIQRQVSDSSTSQNEHEAEHKTKFSHKHIHLQQGDSLTLELAGYQHDEVEAYVRDTDIATQQDGTLIAGEVGDSEVIFIVANTLHILPLTVSASSAAPDMSTGMPEDADTEQIVEPAQAFEQFSSEFQQSLYGEITIQIIDERSYDSYIYPVDDVDVRILGTDLELRTDAQGKVRITGMPLQGRVLVEFSDSLGRYVAGLQEITLDPSVNSYRLVALRTLTDDSMETVSGKVRHAQLASMCGELDQGEAFRVEIDAPADGVFYFNKLGLLDLRQHDTAAFPRFCVLNAEPGPMTVFVTDEQGETVGVFNVGLAAGHHTEETFNLWTDSALRMHLSTSGITSHKRQSVDSAQVRMLGASDALSVREGWVNASPSYHQQRSHLVVEDPDFEHTLHALEQHSANPVLSLLPRGTLAHIALRANVPYHAEMGSVYAEVGYEDADDIRLIAADGHEITPTWLEQRTTLRERRADRVATFLNLPFGVYQLLVRNNNGHWLAVQTLMVYDESVSQLRIGNKLRYHATD